MTNRKGEGGGDFLADGRVYRIITCTQVFLMYQVEILPLYALMFYDVVFCYFSTFESVLGNLGFPDLNLKFFPSPDSLHTPISPRVHGMLIVLFSAAPPTHCTDLPPCSAQFLSRFLLAAPGALHEFHSRPPELQMNTFDECFYITSRSRDGRSN
jgi:hypothetical protein